MKLRALAPLMFVFCLCCASPVYPQMTPHYDVYTAYSYDGTSIYTSVLTDGYTSGCCIPPTITHTPSSYNTIGGVGGWGYGNPDCWTCYISYENDQSIVAIQGTSYEFDSEGQVECSQAGLFFDQIPPILWLRLVASSFVFESEDSSGICHYSPTCTGHCTLDGRATPAKGWPGNICPAFLFCGDIYATPIDECLVGLCKALTYDEHLCT